MEKCHDILIFLLHYHGYHTLGYTAIIQELVTQVD